MNVVRHAPDGEQFLLSTLQNAGDVFVEFFKVFLGKEVVTTLDGKNDVDVDLRIGVRHNEKSETGRSYGAYGFG